jgi:hypothetical protein
MPATRPAAAAILTSPDRLLAVRRGVAEAMRSVGLRTVAERVEVGDYDDSYDVRVGCYVAAAVEKDLFS